jgi:hypothetical protein
MRGFYALNEEKEVLKLVINGPTGSFLGSEVTFGRYGAPNSVNWILDGNDTRVSGSSPNSNLQTTHNGYSTYSITCQSFRDISNVGILSAPLVTHVDLSLCKHIYDIAITATSDNIEELILPETFGNMNPASASAIFGQPKGTSVDVQNAFSSGNLTTLDMSGLYGLWDFLGQGNGVENIIFPETNPATASPINRVYLTSCPNLKTVDMSNLNTIAGQVRFNSCNNLESVLFPTVATTSTPITELSLSSTGLSGSVDLSGLGNLSNNFNANTINNVTEIIFPTTYNTFASFQSLSNTSGGPTSLDLTPIKKLSGSVNFNQSYFLEEIILPPSDERINTLNVRICSLNGLDITPLTFNYNAANPISIIMDNARTGSTFDQVGNSAINKLLVDLDNKGWTDCSLNNSGNAVASTASYDGLTAKANLIAKGWSLSGV